MQVSLVEADGIPEGCLLSVRAGTTRRQATIGTDKPCQLSFPKGIAHASPVKVELLAVLGNCSLEPNLAQTTYPCEVKSKYGGQDMHVTLRIQDDAGARNVRPPSARDDNLPNQPYILNVQSPTAEGAHAYLDSHDLLTWLHDTLHSLIQDRPDDPWAYIDRSTAKARVAQANASVESQSRKHSCAVNRVSHEGVIPGTVFSSTVILRTPATSPSPRHRERNSTLASTTIAPDPSSSYAPKWQNKPSVGTWCMPSKLTVSSGRLLTEHVSDILVNHDEPSPLLPEFSSGWECLANSMRHDDAQQKQPDITSPNIDDERDGQAHFVTKYCTKKQWLHQASVGTWCLPLPSHCSQHACVVSGSSSTASMPQPQAPLPFGDRKDESWSQPSVATWCYPKRARILSLPTLPSLDPMPGKDRGNEDDSACTRRDTTTTKTYLHSPDLLPTTISDHSRSLPSLPTLPPARSLGSAISSDLPEISMPSPARTIEQLNDTCLSRNERLRLENARLRKLREARDAGLRLWSENDRLKHQLGKLRNVQKSVVGDS